MGANNWYNWSDTKKRLQAELDATKNELPSAPDSRKQFVQNKINNLEQEIRELEKNEPDKD